LKYESSERSCFRVVPSFKYQQESQGGYIWDNDIVYLISVVDSGSRIFADPYLHASRSIGGVKNKHLGKKAVEKKEVNVSTDRKTNWK